MYRCFEWTHAMICVGQDGATVAVLKMNTKKYKWNGCLLKNVWNKLHMYALQSNHLQMLKFVYLH